MEPNTKFVGITTQLTVNWIDKGMTFRLQLTGGGLVTCAIKKTYQAIYRKKLKEQ